MMPKGKCRSTPATHCFVWGVTMKRLAVLLTLLAIFLNGCSHLTPLQGMFGLPQGEDEPVLIVKSQPQAPIETVDVATVGTSAKTERTPRSAGLDSDLDGIVDNVDECPRTPGDVAVDSFGCPVPLYMKMRVTYAMSQVEADAFMLQRVENIGQMMQQNPNSMVVVEGHTDDVGDEAANLKLSEERAVGIKTLLTQIYGIEAARIKTVGYGENRPLVSNATENGRSRNRRVELSLSGYYRSETSYIALHRPYNINFDTADVSISGDLQKKIDDLGRYLSQNESTVALIDGYTDNQGASDINNRISQQRADSVRQYLQEKYAIAGERLQARGHGEQSPIASNETEHGRAMNRRVTITVNRLDNQVQTSTNRFKSRLSLHGRVDTASYAPLENRVNIQFKAGVEELDAISQNKIDEIGLLLQKSPNVQILIEGHAASSGNRGDTIRLSRVRAENVKRYLQSKYDISPDRLSTIGFGSDLPLADAGQVDNERVQIKIKRF